MNLKAIVIIIMASLVCWNSYDLKRPHQTFKPVGQVYRRGRRVIMEVVTIRSMSLKTIISRKSVPAWWRDRAYSEEEHVSGSMNR